jgi:hypothetical protein
MKIADLTDRGWRTTADGRSEDCSVTPDNSDRIGRRGVHQRLFRGNTSGQAERDDPHELDIGVNAKKRPVRPNGDRPPSE